MMKYSEAMEEVRKENKIRFDKISNSHESLSKAWIQLIRTYHLSYEVVPYKLSCSLEAQIKCIEEAMYEFRIQMSLWREKV